MIDTMLQQALSRVLARFAELDRLLSAPDVARDPKKLRDLSRERARLSRTVEVSEAYKRLQKTLADDRARSTRAIPSWPSWPAPSCPSWKRARRRSRAS